MQVKGSFFSQKKLTIYHGSLTITILHYKGFVVMILLLCSISLSKKKKGRENSDTWKNFNYGNTSFMKNTISH